jgi:hypothetical protein
MKYLNLIIGISSFVRKPYGNIQRILKEKLKTLRFIINRN